MLHAYAVVTLGIILFLLKPLLYLAAFALGAVLFKRSGPHSKLSPWLVVGLATVARLLVGVLGLLLAASVGRENMTVFYGILMGFGFLAWFGTAKVAFRRASPGGLFLFALVAESVSILIDASAKTSVEHINFC